MESGVGACPYRRSASLSSDGRRRRGGNGLSRGADGKLTPGGFALAHDDDGAPWHPTAVESAVAVSAMHAIVRNGRDGARVNGQIVQRASCTHNYPDE